MLRLSGVSCGVLAVHFMKFSFVPVSDVYLGVDVH